MRIFAPELEERAFRHGLLKEWRAARLVSPEAAAKIAAAIGAPPAQAAWPLRVVLFGFGALCQSAAFFLVFKDIRGHFAQGAAALFGAAVSVAAAEALIRGLKTRRNGVEEALAAGAVLMAAYGAVSLLGVDGNWRWAVTAFSLAFVVAAAAAYARYGYRFAAVGVAVGLGVFTVSLDAGENGTRVLLAVLSAALLLAIAFTPNLPRRERERLEIARFFLALSAPLCLNLALDRLFAGFFGRGAGVTMDAFGWFTFAAIFLIPAGWLAWGISSRARSLLWAGGIGLLVGFCSIKPYFGWARHSWDPAVLGVELIVLVLVLKRWLDSGPAGRRGGFSSEERGNSAPGGALTLLAGAIAAAPGTAPSGPETMTGHGGGFGGGGADGSF